MVFFPIVGLRGEIIKEDLRRKLVGLWNEQVVVKTGIIKAFKKHLKKYMDRKETGINVGNWE